MIVEYDGVDYTFELEEMSVEQATVIKNKWGLTLTTLDVGLRAGDPAALSAIWYMMLDQSGKKPIPDRLPTFKMFKLLEALGEADKREAEEKENKGESPKK